MAHKYHWLVLRDAEGLARQSVQYGIGGGDEKQKPDNVIVTIESIKEDHRKGQARVLRASPVSSNQLHAVLSEANWDNGKDALAWAAREGEMFLDNRVDAFVVAVPIQSHAD